MRRTGLLVLYVVGDAAIALGGVGDLRLRALFEVQAFLGTAHVPAPTMLLILHLLHALGGGLVGIGIASFALVHFAVRRSPAANCEMHQRKGRDANADEAAAESMQQMQDQ